MALPAGLKREVAARTAFQCAYCRSQEAVAGVQFTVDHILPKSLGGTDELDNLFLACWDCNLFKRDRVAGLDSLTDTIVPVYHPNRQAWTDHFAWTEDGIWIVGLTPTGRATVRLLRLNRSALIHARRSWVEVGWHPPLPGL